MIRRTLRLSELGEELWLVAGETASRGGRGDRRRDRAGVSTADLAHDARCGEMLNAMFQEIGRDAFRFLIRSGLIFDFHIGS
ncbi:hypothetical protein NBH00_18170 [Paraconexibacter antarcticus]|uniref:Uncharacterized protein n=1 Tax=Paraconexibacter antarcticus TaxID=2949664 RepID=A0ABY5DMR2_9ACTN|nr:hypothetical protein [Paraconexibacter antarcticus]UTI63273.1 hypothetical protein NBH00_18170 [Paraconexibacter antarcticus]